uniref:Nucleolar pre-ribosomal-associated protein 1 C-terminal domain-containing protein n=1 Tax=Ditylenchus dipsaci TaxID=166011 RepID=A0A915CRT1_9BILA
MLEEHINQDKVLDYFDGKKMWMTLLKMTKMEREGLQDPELYDPKIVLCILLHTVRPGAELSCRKFIKSNALSFCFAATSFHSDQLRSYAFVVLARFQQKLKDLSEEVFAEAPLYLFVMRIFKNSIEECNERVCHVVSHFFARACKLILVPEDPVYAPVMAFFGLKPAIQMRTVPEFLKLFFSSSTEHFKNERQWTLRLCSEAMLEPQDYQILCSSYVVESCLALFVSPIADLWTKKLVLSLLKNCVEHESVAKELFYRLNILSWIVQAIEYSRTTDLEESELVQIFIQTAEHLRNIHREADGTDIGDRRKRRKLAKSAEKKSPLTAVTVKTNAQRMLGRIRKWEEKQDNKKWIKKIKYLIKEDWEGQAELPKDQFVEI